MKKETVEKSIDDVTNDMWLKTAKARDDIAELITKSYLTPVQVLSALLMNVSALLEYNVKEECLDDKNDYLGKLLILSGKILEKSGIVRK
jgi:hypothetical protein